MPKGQLSWVLLPGNSCMLFPFWAAVRVLQQPHKYSYSLQLAIHTQHHYIQYALWALYFFFCCCCSWSFLVSPRGVLQSIALPCTHPSDMPSLFILGAAMGIVNRSTTLLNFTWVTSFGNNSWEKFKTGSICMTLILCLQFHFRFHPDSHSLAFQLVTLNTRHRNLKAVWNWKCFISPLSGFVQ